MHTRRKGQSGSKRPIRREPPAWIGLSKGEIEKTVVDLSAQGNSTSRIGLVLRDRYGVPDVTISTGKKISQILKEKAVAPKVPEDIHNLIAKALKLQKHVAANPKDMHNQRSLKNTESKIRRLEKYYHRKGVLPKEWKYSLETAEMLIAR
jgi:small subunit ribosomal protein S15